MFLRSLLLLSKGIKAIFYGAMTEGRDQVETDRTGFLETYSAAWYLSYLRQATCLLWASIKLRHRIEWQQKSSCPLTCYLPLCGFLLCHWRTWNSLESPPKTQCMFWHSSSFKWLAPYLLTLSAPPFPHHQLKSFLVLNSWRKVVLIHKAWRWTRSAEFFCGWWKNLLSRCSTFKRLSEMFTVCRPKRPKNINGFYYFN